MKIHIAALFACFGTACCVSSPHPPTSTLPAISVLPVAVFSVAVVPKAEEVPNMDPLSSYDPTCPNDMAYISGMFCTEVRQTCIKYVDPPENKFARCAEFAPSVCLGKKTHMEFCIDTEEHHPPDSDMPSTDVSWNDAAQECVQEGKRLCQENEWTFACEGEQMFPYTTGYIRPSDKCNFDKTNLVVNGVFRDQSMSIKENPQCLSPFGVHNMNGNVDELTTRSYSSGKYANALKGGWWAGLRNRCRVATTGHDDSFHELQVGFRCCADTAK